jgi:hypothetical protein
MSTFGIWTTPEREGAGPVDERRAELRQRQRDAIWKWRWLGLRESTPGFKGMVVVLGVAVVYIVVRALTAL